MRRHLEIGPTDAAAAVRDAPPSRCGFELFRRFRTAARRGPLGRRRRPEGARGGGRGIRGAAAFLRAAPPPSGTLSPPLISARLSSSRHAGVRERGRGRAAGSRFSCFPGRQQEAGAAWKPRRRCRWRRRRAALRTHGVTPVSRCDGVAAVMSRPDNGGTRDALSGNNIRKPGLRLCCCWPRGTHRARPASQPAGQVWLGGALARRGRGARRVPRCKSGPRVLQFPALCPTLSCPAIG